MAVKLDEGLKALLESGKEKGYLTYSQVNEYLPDDADNPAGTDGRTDLDQSFMEDDGDRRIDDPARMYLTQMGEIPLLKRDEEISLAKKIEVTRKRFRRKVLECDYALSNVVETLKRVHTGDLPFDRTVKVSLTENLEKDKILQRMPHNLKTLERLLEQNVDDFTQSMEPTIGEEE